MSASARIAAFVALLGLVFGAATLLGAELDPGVDEGGHAEEARVASDGGEHGEPDGEHDEPDGEHDEPRGGAQELPGLAVAQAGYRLEPVLTHLNASPSEDFSFRIVDETGETVRDFEVEHEREMHLIVVGRDFSNFQHVHPRQLADGSWQVELDLRSAGVYRAFADFATGEESLTLATDLFVAGDFRPESIPPLRPVASAGDGYEVEIHADTTGPGSSAVEFTVSRNGRPLDSVEPYLGADGHLVALREHDQAYLHTHPEDKAGGGGPITFEVSYPTTGRYRLFLQFKHRGEVRTAAFTQVVGAGEIAEEAPHGH